MGTRCLTHIADDDGQHLLTIYRQYDGYPEGHGSDLLRFTRGLRLTNGIGRLQGTRRQMANGMGDFAMRLVAYLKRCHRAKGAPYDWAGTFYIERRYSPAMVDFIYHIDSNLKVTCFDSDGNTVPLGVSNG